MSNPKEPEFFIAENPPSEKKNDSETLAPMKPPIIESITLSDRAERIRSLQADVQRGIIEIGFELIAAKKEIGHGNWEIGSKTNSIGQTARQEILCEWLNVLEIGKRFPI